MLLNTQSTDIVRSSIYLFNMILPASDEDAGEYLFLDKNIKNSLPLQTLDTLRSATPAYYFSFNFRPNFTDFSVNPSSHEQSSAGMDLTRNGRFLREYKKKFRAYQKVSQERYAQLQ